MIGSLLGGGPDIDIDLGPAVRCLLLVTGWLALLRGKAGS